MEVLEQAALLGKQSKRQIKQLRKALEDMERPVSAGNLAADRVARDRVASGKIGQQPSQSMTTAIELSSFFFLKPFSINFAIFYSKRKNSLNWQPPTNGQ